MPICERAELVSLNVDLLIGASHPQLELTGHDGGVEHQVAADADLAADEAILGRKRFLFGDAVPREERKFREAYRIGDERGDPSYADAVVQIEVA